MDEFIPDTAMSSVEGSLLLPAALNAPRLPDAPTRPAWVSSHQSERDDAAFLSAFLTDKHARLKGIHAHLAKAEELYNVRRERCETVRDETLQLETQIGVLAQYEQEVQSLRDEIAAREGEYNHVLGFMEDVAFPVWTIEDIAGSDKPRLPMIPAPPKPESPFEAYLREVIPPEDRLPFKYWEISCIPSETYPDEKALPWALQQVDLNSHGALWVNHWVIPRPRHGYIVFVCRGTQQFATQRQLDILTMNRPLEVVVSRWPNGIGFDYVGSFKPLQRWHQYVDTVLGDFPELFEGFSETNEDDVRWKQLITHWYNTRNDLVFQVFKHVGFNREYYGQLELLARPEKRRREDLDMFSSRAKKRARYA